MRTHRLYTTIIIFTGILSISAAIFFLSYDYNSLITKAVAISGKPYLEDILRKRVFPESKFHLLRNICFRLLAIIPIAAFVFIRYRSPILSFIRTIFQSVRQGVVSVVSVFANNSKKENILVAVVLLTVLARSMYYIITFDLQYDEMWSYNYFTAQPFYYPFIVSSNYPLYEVSTQLFKWLPFDMKINLRLPVVITGILSCLVTYACFRKWFDNGIAALGGTVLYAFMPVTTFYMLYARGVIFAQLFAIIAVFSVLFWLRNGQQKRYLILYSIAIALGLYSMPTFVYLWLVFFLFQLVGCLVKYRSQLIYIIIANIAAAGLGALLYLPFIAGSGISFLLDASSGNNQMSLADGWQYITGTSYFFSGSDWILICLFILLPPAIFINRQSPNRLMLLITCLALCAIPVATYVLQNIRIAPRALSFSALSLPLLLGYLIMLYENKIKPVPAIGCIAVVGACMAWVSSRNDFLTWSRADDKATKELSALFLQHHIATCYDNSDSSNFFYYYPALEYYYSTAHQTFTLTTSAKNSLRYHPFSVTGNYDCIVRGINDTLAINSYHRWIEKKEEGFAVYVHDGNL